MDSESLPAAPFVVTVVPKDCGRGKYPDGDGKCHLDTETVLAYALPPIFAGILIYSGLGIWAFRRYKRRRYMINPKASSCW